MPSVFSLANIERGDFYDSSFIYYTKFLLATLGILPDTFHQNTLGPVVQLYGFLTTRSIYMTVLQRTRNSNL